MSWKIIPIEGPERVFETRASIQAVYKELKPNSGCCDTVNLRNGQIMMVDDTGMVDGLPVNPRATELYHSVCKPGTVFPICGDVAVVNDKDFA